MVSCGTRKTASVPFTVSEMKKIIFVNWKIFEKKGHSKSAVQKMNRQELCSLFDTQSTRKYLKKKPHPADGEVRRILNAKNHFEHLGLPFGETNLVRVAKQYKKLSSKVRHHPKAPHATKRLDKAFKLFKALDDAFKSLKNK
jgi:hypothetical protein